MRASRVKDYFHMAWNVNDRGHCRALRAGRGAWGREAHYADAGGAASAGRGGGRVAILGLALGAAARRGGPRSRQAAALAARGVLDETGHGGRLEWVEGRDLP